MKVHPLSFKSGPLGITISCVYDRLRKRKNGCIVVSKKTQSSTDGLPA